jgi:preprotein translocase SecE subunit
VAQAKKQPKKRVLKRVETVRERASKTTKSSQPQRLRQARIVIAKPLKRVNSAIARLLRPFGFMLKPFKTRPMRIIGRVLARILLLSYFRESWNELRQVKWPSRKQTWQLTLAVFTFALFFGVIIAVTDFGLDKLFKALILE